MERNDVLNGLLKTFSELYWLKPVDIVWDSVNAYHIQKMIGNDENILDLGCGDGMYATLMFGGKLSKDYDRFLNVNPVNQAIKENQFGDIYSNPVINENVLARSPRRKINVGLELKTHHIRVAESLGVYDQIIKGKFEEFTWDGKAFDKIFSIFAFYWGDDLASQFRQVRTVLDKDGEFIVNLPSEHLFDLHAAKKMSEEKSASPLMKDYFDRLDGGRRELTSRYGRTVKEWEKTFDENGFEIVETIPIVNELLFTLQDVAQRPFLPMFFKMADDKKFQHLRQGVRDYLCEEVYPDLIDELLQYESDPAINHGYYLFRAIIK
jgi:SAM-dependent methyltransferase